MGNRRFRSQVADAADGNLPYELQNRIPIEWRDDSDTSGQGESSKRLSEKLRELQNRWVQNTPENADAFLAQIQIAWDVAYRHIWNSYDDYTDDERSDAAIRIFSDLRNYDPQKGSLESFIKARCDLRTKTAWEKGIDIEYDPPGEPDGQEKWLEQLALYQEQYDGTGQWAAAVQKHIYAHYAPRITQKFRKQKIRTAANAVKFDKEAAIQQQFLNELLQMLLSFNPQQQSLAELVQAWEQNNWSTEKTQPEKKGKIQTSLDTPVGEDGNTSLGNLHPDSTYDPAIMAENRLASKNSILLLALLANYQLHVGQGKLKARTRYARLNYTEQLACFAQAVPLPDDHAQDILNPLEDDYFRYFMHTTPEPLSLRSVEDARLRTVIGSGPYLLENEQWDKSGLLPAKAQMGYLDSIGIRSSDATVSGHRKPYKAGFLSDLEKRR